MRKIVEQFNGGRCCIFEIEIDGVRAFEPRVLGVVNGKYASGPIALYWESVSFEPFGSLNDAREHLRKANYIAQGMQPDPESEWIDVDEMRAVRVF